MCAKYSFILVLILETKHFIQSTDHPSILHLFLGILLQHCVVGGNILNSGEWWVTLLIVVSGG